MRRCTRQKGLQGNWISSIIVLAEHQRNLMTALRGWQDQYLLNLNGDANPTRPRARYPFCTRRGIPGGESSDPCNSSRAETGDFLLFHQDTNVPHEPRPGHEACSVLSDSLPGIGVVLLLYG